MKKFISLLLVIFSVMAFTTINVFAHAKPSKINVNDFSGVISDAVKDYVTAKNDILFEKTEAKIIFVTTETTDGLSINDYTENLYKSWGIGSLGRKNSIFIVIDTEKSEYGFVRGKNIRYAFPDAEIYQYFIDYFEPSYSEDSYDRAVMTLYNAFGKWYESQYNDLSLDLDDDLSHYMYGVRRKETERTQSKTFIWVMLLVCVFTLGLALKIKHNYRLKTRKAEREKQKTMSQVDIDKIPKP